MRLKDVPLDCAFRGYKNFPCKVLTNADCYSCSFYKTKEQLKDGRIKAYNRLKHLPNGKIIIEKYYGKNQCKDITEFDEESETEFEEESEDENE